MASGILSKNPRIRNIRVHAWGHRDCIICGKSTSKHKDKPPAPVHLRLRVATGDSWAISGSVCLGCAKRLSSRLDAVIEQIESEYK